MRWSVLLVLVILVTNPCEILAARVKFTATRGRFSRSPGERIRDRPTGTACCSRDRSLDDTRERTANTHRAVPMVDDQGVVNWTNDSHRVPERFRSKALRADEGGPGSEDERGRHSRDRRPGHPPFRRNTMLVQATVNRSQNALLVLDTGASVTTLSPLVITRLGVSLLDAPRRRIFVVGGASFEVPFVTVALQIGDVTIENLEVAVTEGTGPETDGLLSTDVLNRFKAVLDRPGRRMTLEPLGR